jgi:hypothetical protein
MLTLIYGDKKAEARLRDSALKETQLNYFMTGQQAHNFEKVPEGYREGLSQVGAFTLLVESDTPGRQQCDHFFEYSRGHNYRPERSPCSSGHS